MTMFEAYEIMTNSNPESAFGVNLDEQIAILERAKTFFETTRYDSNRIKFQAGMIKTINALIGFIKFICDRYNVPYVLLSKLTQDWIESYFGVMRGMNGPSDNPSPLELLYRIRKDLIMRFLEDQDFDLAAMKRELEMAEQKELPSIDLDLAALNDYVDFVYDENQEEVLLDHASKMAFKCRHLQQGLISNASDPYDPPSSTGKTSSLHI